MAMNWRTRLGAWVGGFGVPGGFDATSGQRRLKGFVTSRAHVNALIAASGPEMNARARWLVRNNGYAANALESWAANTVGDGISPNSSIEQATRKDAVQRLWLAWTDDADAEGLTDLYGLQRRASREVFMTGEVFLRFRPRRAEDGLSVPLQIQMLPSEMLPLGHNVLDANGNIIRQGIEFDRIGRRAAYHFLRRHPGDSTDPGLSGETVRVPASEVLHVIDPVEAGQLRGVSRFAPAIVKLFLLDQYDDAELDRKKVAAMYAMFVTSPAPDNPLAPPEEEYEVAPGQVVRLDPGEDVTVSAPADSGATYEPFQYRTLLQISAALGIPYGYLTNDGAKGNFSNSRLSLIEFRRRVSAWQHSVMVFQLCRPVWARFMDTAVLAGGLKLPGYDRRRAEYLTCNWLPTKWDWVDPLKDANAEIAQIEAGLKSRTQAIAERGYDAEQVDAEIAREREREKRLGLDFRRPGSPAQGPGTTDTNETDPNAGDPAPADTNRGQTQDPALQEGN